MKTIKIACCLGLLLVMGCGLEGPIPSGRKHGDATANKVAEQPVADAKTAEKTAGGPAGTAQKAGMVQEKVEFGGEKGKGYGDGFIGTPLKTLWAVKGNLAAMQLKKAVDTYKAQEGHPPTEKDFMDKIIKANDIHLPPLPPGGRYVYDSDKEELILLKPKTP